MDSLVGREVDGWRCEWMGGGVDGWKDGWVNGWVNGQSGST